VGGNIRPLFSKRGYMIIYSMFNMMFNSSGGINGNYTWFCSGD
jgi:hypothetical protein